MLAVGSCLLVWQAQPYFQMRFFSRFTHCNYQAFLLCFALPSFLTACGLGLGDPSLVKFITKEPWGPCSLIPPPSPLHCGVTQEGDTHGGLEPRLYILRNKTQLITLFLLSHSFSIFIIIIQFKIRMII